MSTNHFPFRLWDHSAIVAAEVVLWSIYWPIKRNWTSLLETENGKESGVESEISTPSFKFICNDKFQVSQLVL